MSIDMAQFHQVFFEESFEGLDIMEQGLLNLDPGAADTEEINAIFRAAHSIKGGSGTFGFADVSDFTHIMETLLDEMREGERPVTGDATDVLLNSVDVLREMLTAARDGGGVDENRVKQQHDELQRVSSNEGPDASADLNATESNVDHSTDSESEIIGWHIVFRPHPHLLRSGNDPLRILRELSRLGELDCECDLSGLPRLSELEPEDCYLSWDLRLNAPVEKSLVDEIFEWVEDDCDFAIIPIVNATAAPTPSNQAKSTTNEKSAELTPVPKPDDRRAESERRASGERPKAAGAGSSSIRVDIDKIDSLINMVGELVITQSMLGMLGMLGEEFDETPKPQHVERLREGLVQLERHTRELQEGVMQVRMLPISFTFSRFPRLVHDISSKLGKKIELQLNGETTEVDKTVIEKIGDPLVHLVRNSLDHGIETPEDRLAAGKPATGTVQLNAFHKGGNIIIEIRDDGRGLNRDRILAKAIERGLVSAEDNLSNQQIYELIFQPGFSTADQISDVSGRGVGMDVVRRNINELGGSIEIESELGEGSAIIIRLPLTLAILDGQTIRVGDETYIVPLVSIVESIQIEQEMINRVAGKGETFKLRSEYLPVLRLHDLFNIDAPRATELQDGLLVVVEGDGRRCGLFVDDLLGQQQVVIKSLEANYQRVEGISGATILGDGSVALILDIPSLMRLGRQGRQHTGRSDLALTA